MRREDESKNVNEEKPAAVLMESAAGSGYRTISGAIIDFHAPEFNHSDDLDDLSREHRTFQPLDGVITADMLHQMKRREHAVDAAIFDHPNLPARDPLEKDTAEPARDSAHEPPLNLTSRGRILIIDTDAKRARTWGTNLGAAGMTCTAVVTGEMASVTSVSRSDGFPLLQMQRLSVAGVFGNFSAMTSTNGELKPLAQWLDADAAVFDLILDFQPAVSFTGRSLPLGYYAPGPKPEHPDELLAELPRMRGQFQKPQFTTFQESRCLHQHSRNNRCHQCLDVCPFSAIQSLAGKLIFNHRLCQGCGACGLVCPTDAVCLVHPSQPERLDALWQAIAGRKAENILAPTLVITDDNSACKTDKSDNGQNIYFTVDQIGYVGSEMTLLALVYGAGKVIVSCDPENDQAVIKAVRNQALLSRTILRGLGQPEDLIRFTISTDSDHQETGMMAEIHGGAQLVESRLSPEALFCLSDRRALILLAARKLHDRLNAKQTVLPLPDGFPFGAVSIDPACTLCMACVEACPSKALRADGVAPRLEFIESRCHQCGLCEDICPEKAIRLQPRILCDPERVEAPVVLHEVQAARCILCGAPFASQAMVNRIQTNLAGHWMYASEKQLRRLQMCRTCRTRDALMSEDIKIWNQSHVR